MKAPLKPRRPSPDEALAIAASTAPQQPPTQVQQVELPKPATIVAPSDIPTTLNLRMRRSSVMAVEAAAKAKGMTMKQVIGHALKAAGVPIAEADLEDRTPRRK